MIKEFVMNHVFMSSILFVGLLSLFLQAIMVLSLKGYVKASANMKTTRKKVMINLKNQFEAIYGMDYQIRNSAAYVDKYLLKLRFLGFSFSTWEKVPFLSAGIATILAGAGIFHGYMTSAGEQAQIEILFSYGMVLVCLFVFFHIFGIKSKKQQMQIQLVDYLENYLTNRLTRTKEGGRELNLLEDDIEAVFMEESEKKQSAKEAEKQKEQSVDMEEDMEMLKRLLRDVESGEAKTMKQQVAAADETHGKEMGEDSDSSEESEIELLEEFVKSFLA